MAPNLFGDVSSLKRSAQAAEFDDFGPLSVKRRYHRHHKPRWRQEIDCRELHCDGQESTQSQLLRALVLVLQAVGFEYADPLALESLRAEVEQYMAHFLASARQSMLTSRRSQPVPQDFLNALHAHQLTLGALLLHLDPPVDPNQTQPLLHVAPQSFPNTRIDDAAVSRLLREPATASALHLPRGFPALPSRHTYKAEPVYPHREVDPKVIRERATEEGRRGEEALRRLASRRPAEAKAQPAAAPATVAEGERQPPKAGVQDLWMDTTNSVIRDFPAQPGSREATPMEDSTDTPQEMFLSGHIPPPVNWDRAHWRRAPVQSSSHNRALESGMSNG